MDLVRGDIHWVSFPKREPRGAEIEKDRPCIIVSHQNANMFRKTVVVVPLTHGSRDAPPIIISIPSGGHDSKAICDQIVAVDKARIGRKYGSLTLQELQYFEDSLRSVLGLGP
jgi:mRNA interferase MazF